MAFGKKTTSIKKEILVVANWKMNPTAIGDAKRLFLEVKKAARHTKVPAVIAAPFPYIAELRKLTHNTHVSLGAQDAHFERSGTYTGEVSPLMLKSLGVSHVIVGHSERRAGGETDETISKKVTATLKAGMTPILCIGETKRDSAGQYLGVVEKQLRAALKPIAKTQIKNVVLAYEPVWAISKGDGKGKTATPADAYEMKLFIQKLLTDRYDRKTAESTHIIYGGSVNPKNAEELLEEGMVDGFLVGGASLKPKEFTAVLAAVHNHGTH